MEENIEKEYKTAIERVNSYATNLTKPSLVESSKNTFEARLGLLLLDLKRLVTAVEQKTCKGGSFPPFLMTWKDLVSKQDSPIRQCTRLIIGQDSTTIRPTRTDSVVKFIRGAVLWALICASISKKDNSHLPETEEDGELMRHLYFTSPRDLTISNIVTPIKNRLRIGYYDRGYTALKRWCDSDESHLTLLELKQMWKIAVSRSYKNRSKQGKSWGVDLVGLNLAALEINSSNKPLILPIKKRPLEESTSLEVLKKRKLEDIPKERIMKRTIMPTVIHDKSPPLPFRHLPPLPMDISMRYASHTSSKNDKITSKEEVTSPTRIETIQLPTIRNFPPTPK